MARGWESKAVAEQMEQTEMRASNQLGRYESSPAVRARREKVESLQLSLARTLAQLQHASTPAHRQMLQRTLRALESEIEELS